MKRAALLSVMTLAALNIWTGAPLLAVWVGSRVVSTSQPTMGAVFLWVEYEAAKVGPTALERLLVAMVVVAVTLFEIWFFFFSPSPIPA